MGGKGKQYKTLAPTFPVAPTTGGADNHHVVGGQPGKKGMSKKKANLNNKGKLKA